MKISDMISMCLSNLLRRKVRTILTVLGVVIGTCAIIVTVSLGVGMTQIQEEALAQMGDLTKIQVYNYNTSSDSTKLDDQVLDQIAAMQGVDVVTPLVNAEWGSFTIQTTDGKYIYESQIIGMYPEAMEKLGYTLKEGSYLKSGEKGYTLVFGENAAYQFRTAKDYEMVWQGMTDSQGNPIPAYVDPMKDEFVLKLGQQDEDAKEVFYDVEIKGVLVADYGKGYETDYGVFMPIEDLKALTAEYKRINGIKETSSQNDPGYQNVVVKTSDIKYVEAVEAAIQEMGFETYSMETIRKPMQQQLMQMQLILGGLGFISLVVAAIGIANTMVMSIYERTREIGVMKVIGCVVGNIRSIFLMEAGTIGFFGGLMGLVFSHLLSYVLNHFGGSGLLGGLGMNMGMGMGGGGSEISVIPLWLDLVGMLFATFVGLISGFAPANRAVKISALEAIKHD